MMTEFSNDNSLRRYYGIHGIQIKSITKFTQSTKCGDTDFNNIQVWMKCGSADESEAS